MDREEIEELAKDLIPMAEEQNASQAIMTADYDDKWALERRNITERNPQFRGRINLVDYLRNNES